VCKLGLKDLTSGFAHLLHNSFFGLADLQATIPLYPFTERGQAQRWRDGISSRSITSARVVCSSSAIRISHSHCSAQSVNVNKIKVRPIPVAVPF
jgi:hypothetical protein